MATTARLDLSVWRNDDVYEFPLRVRGLDLSALALRMQVRILPDAPGAPLIDLNKVTNGNAEGLRIAGVSVVDGVTTSDLRIRINKSTLAALPYAGEVGDASMLAYALLIGGRTRLVGDFVVLAHTYGSDAAPATRAASAGTRSSGSPPAGATLTIGVDQEVELVIDGADLVGQLTQQAQAAASQAADDAQAAEMAAQVALAASRYFPSRAAGEAGSTTGQLFATSDGAGVLVYYERTSGGSYEIARAVPPATLAAPTGSTLIGRFASVAALLASTAGPRGPGLVWQAAEHSYAEAAPGASDHHLVTAGGVKLYVMPAAAGISAEAFGILEANTTEVNSQRYLTLLAFANGRQVLFKAGRFKVGATWSGPANIRGQGKPSVKADRTALEGGTIIEGGLTFSGSRVILSDFGVDHGSAAFSTSSDALDVSAAPYNSGRLAVLTNLVAIGRAIADGSHAVKVEGFEQVFATNVDGAVADYCVAIKSRNVTLNGSRAIGGRNLWIFKSDAPTGGGTAGAGAASYINASNLIGEGVAGTTHGLRALSANAPIAGLNVTGLHLDGVDTAIELEAETRLSDVNISNATARNVRKFGMKASGAVDEISLSKINLIDVTDYAAQFLDGRITVRDCYVSMKAGATTHVDDFFRVEAAVVGFTASGLKMEENRGAGAAVPTLYLQSPRGYNRLSDIDCRVSGNLPLKGFSDQALAGTSAVITPLFDIDTMRSMTKVSAGANVTITGMATTLPGGAAIPEGYEVTILPISGVTYTFKSQAGGAGSFYHQAGDITRTANQPLTVRWGGFYWYS